MSAKLLLVALASSGCWASVNETSSLGFHSSQYVSSGESSFSRNANSNNSSFVFADERSDKIRGPFTTHLNIKDEFSPSEDWNYFDVYEAYAKVTLPENSSVSLGRKRMRWNEWEENWGVGIIEPRYVEDKMHPQFAGLTGLFAETKGKSTSGTIALLPVYVPDFGPHFYVRDDVFYSANPWFIAPSPAYVFNGQPGDIHYMVNQPDTGKIISHPGIAAKVETTPTKSYLTRVSYAYKPIEQLFIGFPSNRVVVADDETFMQVEITPFVNYQRVLSNDHIYKYKMWTFSAGWMHEDLLLDTPPSNWTYQTGGEAWVFHTGASVFLEPEGPTATRLEFNYLNVNGGDERDQGRFAGDKSLFERRYQYLNAVSLSLKKSFRRGFKRPIDTNSKVIYDQAQNGGCVSLSVSQSFARNWRAGAQVDVLGVFGENARVRDGFLSNYRANDRVGVEMDYVF